MHAVLFMYHFSIRRLTKSVNVSMGFCLFWLKRRSSSKIQTWNTKDPNPSWAPLSSSFLRLSFGFFFPPPRLNIGNSPTFLTQTTFYKPCVDIWKPSSSFFCDSALANALPQKRWVFTAWDFHRLRLNYSVKRAVMVFPRNIVWKMKGRKRNK